MASALDAMPVKQLIAGEVVRDSKHVCAIGSVAVARNMNVEGLDIYDRDEVSRAFGVAPALAAEIAFLNDDDFGYRTETPEARWKRMREWVNRNLLAGQSEGSGIMWRSDRLVRYGSCVPRSMRCRNTKQPRSA
jgi:hypothetical protein